MNTVPTTSETRKPTRKPRPKPERFAHVSHVGDAVILVLLQHFPKKGDVIDSYTLECFPSDLGGKGIQLTKLDGTRYYVELNGPASSCDCKGHLAHRHCKHVDSLLALAAAGQL